jgi:hypothetical protein
LISAVAQPASPDAVAYGVGSEIVLTFDAPLNGSVPSSLADVFQAAPDDFFQRANLTAQWINATALLLVVASDPVSSARGG